MFICRMQKGAEDFFKRTLTQLAGFLCHLQYLGAYHFISATQFPKHRKDVISISIHTFTAQWASDNTFRQFFIKEDDVLLWCLCLLNLNIKQVGGKFYPMFHICKHIPAIGHMVTFSGENNIFLSLRLNKEGTGFESPTKCYINSLFLCTTVDRMQFHIPAAFLHYSGSIDVCEIDRSFCLLIHLQTPISFEVVPIILGNILLLFRADRIYQPNCAKINQCSSDQMVATKKKKKDS